VFEIQAQYLRDCRQNRRVAPKSHDIIHALFRLGDSASLYGVSHGAVSKIEAVSDSALSIVEFASCFLWLANLPNFDEAPFGCQAVGRSIASSRQTAIPGVPQLDLAPLTFDRASEILSALTPDAVYCVGGMTDVELASRKAVSL
jgi:hypothetical protein